MTAPARSSWLWLAGVVAAGALVVAGAVVATRERIARNDAAESARLLQTVLPAGRYDNQPALDRVMVLAPELLGSADPLPVYRARLHGEPVAAILTVVARQGYVGPITLLVAIGVDGRVIGVHALAHQETPGLGGRIDEAGWIGGFAGRSLADPVPEGWAVRRDRGEFDQMTGATITSRAVVNAVRDAALYFEQHRAEIFAPAGG